MYTNNTSNIYWSILLLILSSAAIEKSAQGSKILVSPRQLFVKKPLVNGWHTIPTQKDVQNALKNKNTSARTSDIFNLLEQDVGICYCIQKNEPIAVMYIRNDNKINMTHIQDAENTWRDVPMNLPINAFETIKNIYQSSPCLYRLLDEAAEIIYQSLINNSQQPFQWKKKINLLQPYIRESIIRRLKQKCDYQPTFLKKITPKTTPCSNKNALNCEIQVNGGIPQITVMSIDTGHTAIEDCMYQFILTTITHMPRVMINQKEITGATHSLRKCKLYITRSGNIAFFIPESKEFILYGIYLESLLKLIHNISVSPSSKFKKKAFLPKRLFNRFFKR